MGASHHEGMARRGERVERSSGAAPPRQPGGGDLLQVSIEPGRSGVSIVSLAGELDLSTIPRVESQLLNQLRTQSAVIVDLTRLNFIDSSGIGLLIQAFRTVDNGRRMHTVVAPVSQVDRVFKLAGIDRALPVYFDRREALADLSAVRER
jgi:anti-anti-sigma factor